MRRKSIPATAPVLMSQPIERYASVDACLTTETLYMDNENNMMSAKTEEEKSSQENTNQTLFSDDVPSMYQTLHKKLVVVK